MTTEILRSLEELSASAGGSLVKQIIKAKLSDSSSVFFIGLGGLGCQTVNQIKKVYSQEFAYAENIKFLAVDTCVKDITDFSIGKTNGYLEASEQFLLYDDEAKDLLIIQPPEIKSWIGTLTPRTIDEEGAQGVRQIGRVMLCGTKKYSLLRDLIDENIKTLAKSAPVDVVLISGVAGGTGSGTFIDVAYMLREMDNIKTWGVFYTPDVQKKIPQIKNNKAVWDCLCRNGYAALKELDYYMTNGSNQIGARPIYQLTGPGGLKVVSGKAIFEPGSVFIVSPNKTVTECTDIVQATARSLINMYQEVTADGGFQTILSSYNNSAASHSPSWLNNYVGIQSDPNKPTDPAGNENCEFPAFMNYCYSTFGYNSVYFPRDEIMAYCANEVFTKVINIWNNVNCLSQQNVNAWIKECNLHSIPAIVQAIKTNIRYDCKKLRVDKIRNNAYWPQIKGFLFFSSVSGMEETMKYAHIIVDKEFKVYESSEAYNLIIKDLAKQLINKLSSYEFLLNFGPFAAIATLTGYGKIAGCCTKLTDLKADLAREINESDIALTAARENMEHQAKILAEDKTPTEPEIEYFVDTCMQYSDAYFDNKIHNALLEKVLDGVRGQLLDFNNETFDIYVPIMNTLIDMLNKDATIFAAADNQHFIGRQTFGMDAYGISDSQLRKDKFIKLFSGYINNDQVFMISSLFAQSMFDDKTGKKWREHKDNPADLTNEIRRIFAEFFKPFVNELLEKFLVLAYSEGLVEITVQRLDDIWNAAPGSEDASLRDHAITVAAQEIAAKLQDGSSLLLTAESGPSQLSVLNSSKAVVLLQATPKLNSHILQVLGNSFAVGYLNDSYKSVITAVKYAYPVSLPLVENMNEFAQAYFDSENSEETSAGRHLDESGQNWVKYLPELYGVDTESYYQDYKERHDLIIKHLNGKNHDAELYEEIRQAVEHGLKKGYIFLDDNNRYNLLYITGVDDNYEALLDKYSKLLQHNPDASWIKALKYAADSCHTMKYQVIPLTCNNSQLMAKQAVIPEDPHKLKNLYRVVRYNMETINAVFAAVKDYEDRDLFSRLETVRLNISGLNRYTQKIQLFTKLLLCELVRYNEESKQWQFCYRLDDWHDFFNFKKPKNDLDKLAQFYLAFSGGICQTIGQQQSDLADQKADEMLGEGNYQPRADIISFANDVLNSDLLQEPIAEERDARLNSLYERSLYKSFYNLPRQYDGESSIWYNLSKFYNDLKEGLSVE